MLAILKFLPELLSLIMAIVDLAKAHGQAQAGADEVVLAVIKKAREDIEKATAAALQATADHATKKDDSAFDQDFRRDKP